ncbi:DEAD/DEAH box helicase [Cardiosporidium cionae]|uniref:RNA helicase n=1 Tax=Cardiosporidium cionae TaxID=476202 RepID=A0ABQ7J4H3_9APIC|nr:DEAD/DEAH box helicase [Cardiosporidium cionae]|eukprot:KAF8818040.1 DEAD/DEAH box helicase [Cardiosporidium cionae]
MYNSKEALFNEGTTATTKTTTSESTGCPASHSQPYNIPAEEEDVSVDKLRHFLLSHAMQSPTTEAKYEISAEGHLEEATNVLDRRIVTPKIFSLPASSSAAVTQSPIEVKHSHLSEIHASVAVERSDGDSAYVAATSWEKLNFSGELLKGIYQKGFTKPSKIQAAALPLILLESENLIGQAQNGSGKTATFALCMLSKLEFQRKEPQALCLCPTRELARQITTVIEELGQYTQLLTYLAVPQNEIYKSQPGAHVVVGTPGRTLDLIKRRILPTQSIKLFVLDEADEMIDRRNNMGTQVQQIRRCFRSSPQILLFSATFPDEVKAFATSMVPNANKITVEKENLSLKSVSQFYMMYTDEDNKFQLLSDLYGSMTIGQSVIFVKSRKSAFDLALRMKNAGHAISLICGTQSSGPEKMEHSMRDRIMSEFRAGETKVLICTDVLSRGIDVPQVTLVINYDLPLEYQGRLQGSNTTVSMETYIHRIGRTGRFGLKGIAINLVHRHQLPLIAHIASFYKYGFMLLFVSVTPHATTFDLHAILLCI